MKYWYLVSLNWYNISTQNVQCYSESPLPNPSYSSLFVHPPGLQLVWRLLSLSVGSSESIRVTLSRYRCVCDTSLSTLCMLSSARSFSNSRILIFSWRLLSADKIAENHIHISCVRSIYGYVLYSAQNTINNKVRFLGFGWWRERMTRLSLQLRHSSSVASCCTCCCHGVMYHHNSWMENALYTDKHECSEMQVTCTVGLWEPLAWWYRRPGLTYTCLGCFDKGMVNRILFVWRERQAIRYYSTGWCCWCCWWWTRRLQRIGVKC